MIIHVLKILFLVLIISTASCSTLNNRTIKWNSELPPREIFTEAFRSDLLNQALQSEYEYLEWVKLFYLGKGIAVRGWNSVSSEILEITDHHRRDHAAKRLQELGKKIVIDWAKDNNHRRISTDVILGWSEVIYAAAEHNSHLDVVNLIDSDVDALLSGKLDPAEINQQRYINTLQLQALDPYCDMIDTCAE